MAGTVRQLGYDPKEHFEEMAADNEMLDGLGLVLDSDARKEGGERV